MESLLGGRRTYVSATGFGRWRGQWGDWLLMGGSFGQLDGCAGLVVFIWGEKAPAMEALRVGLDCRSYDLDLVRLMEWPHGGVAGCWRLHCH